MESPNEEPKIDGVSAADGGVMTVVEEAGEEKEEKEEKLTKSAPENRVTNISNDSNDIPVHTISNTDDDNKISIQNNYTNNNINKIQMIKNANIMLMIQPPHSKLPKPEPPPGLSNSDSNSSDADSDSDSDSVDSILMPSSIAKFIKDRSNTFSASIVRRLSSLKDQDDDSGRSRDTSSDVTEINISGLKVIVSMKREKDDDQELKGRITFFSRSNCRDCTAVRSFFKQRGLNYVEINIDVYPHRAMELKERTGSCQVPQIFFNEKLFGGLVALNSLRNCGGLDSMLKEMLSAKCPADAPAPPVYGFDDPAEEEEEPTGQMITVVRVLRQRLPIQDRILKMKIVNNCFSGAHLVDFLVLQMNCSREKAVEIGKQLAREHFIHHVFGGNDFEDGNHYYRFLEHEPFIPKCYNFRVATNDSDPKPALAIGEKLNKLMSAILESYASDDRFHVDYAGISKSEEFRRYLNLVQELHRVDLLKLSQDEKLAFFLNLHNAMVIHAVIRVGCPEGVIDRRSFYSDFQYIVGGFPYSLNTVKNGILRGNRRSPYSLMKPFSAGDKRLQIALPKLNPLIHFGLCNGTRSSPTVRFFTPQGIEAELRFAAREFFQRNGMEVELEKRIVYLTRIIKWFSGDFGTEKEMLRWIINFLDATRAGLLTHLLSDGGPVNVVYLNYDWSVNS